VEGKSGPLKNEITWEELQQRSGYPYPIIEYTTVTGRIRRIAEFDIDLIRRATMVNRPTELALHGVDYLDFANKGILDYDFLTKETKDFISVLENELAVPVTFVGTGPGQGEVIDKIWPRRQLSLAQRSYSDVS